MTKWNLLHRMGHETPIEVQFEALALAYLDSAQRLCKILVRSSRKATFERGAVVLYLTFHSIELFLKGGIVRKRPHEHFGHDVNKLVKRYAKLYPAHKFAFDIPFGLARNASGQQTVTSSEELSGPLHQRMRYPVNHKGMLWQGAEGFEPNSFLEDLSSLESVFRRNITLYSSGPNQSEH